MRRLLILLVLPAIVSTSRAENEISCASGTEPLKTNRGDLLIETCVGPDEEGRPAWNGPTRFSWAGGSTMGAYRNGRKESLWTTRSAEGRVVAETPWKNDLPDGLARRWNDKGKLIDERVYRSGKQAGIARSWDDNGNLIGEWNFKSGLLDGTQRQWSGKGKSGSEEVRSLGRLVRRTELGPNGNPMSTETRELEPGSYGWKVYGENGGPILEGTFKDRRPDGIWKRWSSSGELLRTSRFEKGKLTEDSAPGGPMLDYPQLMVLPRASSRLESAARAERPELIRRSVPFVVAGGLSIAAGIVGLSDTSKVSGALSAVAGGAALVSGVFTAAIPYSEPKTFARGWDEIRDLPTATRESELEREFQAEKRLQQTAGVAKETDFLIAGTLATFNVWSVIDGIRTSNPAATALASGAILVGLVPLALPIPERTVHADLVRAQQKLYTPTVTIGPAGGNLTWRF